ncbi:MAG: AAA family ATPase [Desulfurococcales archaeon]|nr:AAA family ATPase [Desulfurococcales archaeon]
MSSRTTKNIRNKGPVIVVSGPPGSGKTTYAKKLSKNFGLEYYTTGQIFRELAKKLGYTLEEFSRVAEKDPKIDFLIDSTTLEYARKGGVVIDSHLAAWVLAGIADISILVKAHPLVRAQRIVSREQKDKWTTIRETFTRELSQYKRFKEYYGFDLLDYSLFDIVVDTSVLGVDEVYQVIESFVRLKLKKLGYL